MGPNSPPVIVLFGAGASVASGDYRAADRPPLTRQLFKTPHAIELLRTYSLAQEAGRVVDRAMSGDSTLQFERALRELQRDEHRHHRQMALAIAPFLQALLLDYSERLFPDSARYSTLVDELLKIRARKIFVSLNYDTLLDNHLDLLSPLDSPDSYLDAPYGWSLIKPHGSVAWYIPQPEEFDAIRPSGDLELVRQPIKCVPVRNLQLENVRGFVRDDGRSPTSFYPALALPDGPKDELVLPAAHLEHLKAVIDSASEIYLLVLGYSALDTEVLALLADADCQIRRLTVVNASGEAALEVLDRIKGFGLDAIWPDPHDGTLAGWIDNPTGLASWVRGYGGRPQVMDPDLLRRRVQQRRIRYGDAGESVRTQQF